MINYNDVSLYNNNEFLSLIKSILYSGKLMILGNDDIIIRVEKMTEKIHKERFVYNTKKIIVVSPSVEFFKSFNIEERDSVFVMFIDKVDTTLRISSLTLKDKYKSDLGIDMFSKAFLKFLEHDKKIKEK